MSLARFVGPILAVWPKGTAVPVPARAVGIPQVSVREPLIGRPVHGAVYRGDGHSLAAGIPTDCLNAACTSTASAVAAIGVVDIPLGLLLPRTMLFPERSVVAPHHAAAHCPTRVARCHNRNGAGRRAAAHMLRVAARGGHLMRAVLRCRHDARTPEAPRGWSTVAPIRPHGDCRSLLAAVLPQLHRLHCDATGRGPHAGCAGADAAPHPQLAVGWDRADRRRASRKSGQCHILQDCGANMEQRWRRVAGGAQ